MLEEKCSTGKTPKEEIWWNVAFLSQSEESIRDFSHHSFHVLISHQKTFVFYIRLRTFLGSQCDDFPYHILFKSSTIARGTAPNPILLKRNPALIQ